MAALRLVAILALFSGAAAFQPIVRSGRWLKTNHVVYAAKESLIKEAQEASAKYGATSPEAKVAWETVEEMDAADNSAEWKPAMEDDDATMKLKLDELRILTEKAKEINQQINMNIEDLKQTVSLNSNSVAAGAIDETAYGAAKAEAEAATAEFGADSAESRTAWDTVNEIESADDEKITMGGLDEECLVSNMEKCMEYNKAMEELQAVIGDK